MALSRRALIGFAANAVLLAACGQNGNTPPAQTSAPQATAPNNAAVTTPPSQIAASPTAQAVAATTQAPAPTAQPAASTGQPVELKIAGWYNAGNQKVVQKEIDLFTQKFPNAKISIVVIDFHVEKNVVMMASGAAPDVFWVNNDHTAPWAARNAVVALDDYAKRDKVDFNDLYEIGQTIWSYKGKLYGLPEGLAPIILFYNPQLFQAAGIDPPSQTYGDKSWTMDAAVQKATALTKRPSSGPAEQFGINIGTSVYSWLPIMFCDGGKIVDDDLSPTKVTFDVPGTRETIQWVADLMLKYKVSASVSEAQGLPDTTQFTNGKLAMDLNGPWQWPIWMTPEVRGKVAWEMAPVPIGSAAQTTDMAGNAYGMSTQSKSMDTAWELVKFTTIGDGQQLSWDPAYSLGMPGRKSLAESPKWGSWFSEKSKQVIVDSTNHCHYKPKHPNWAEMNTVLDSSLSQIWTGAVTVDQAVPIAQTKMAAVLAGTN